MHWIEIILYTTVVIIVIFIVRSNRVFSEGLGSLPSTGGGRGSRLGRVYKQANAEEEMRIEDRKILQKLKKRLSRETDENDGDDENESYLGIQMKTSGCKTCGGGRYMIGPNSF